MKRKSKYLFLTFSLILIISSVFALIWFHDFKAVRSFSHALANNSFIQSSKAQWSQAYKATNGTVVTSEQLREFDKGAGNDRCLSGGVLSIGRIGESPTCTVHGDLEENPIKEKRILFYKD